MPTQVTAYVEGKIQSSCDYL